MSVVYVANADSHDIAVLRLDAATGTLSPVQRLPVGGTVLLDEARVVGLSKGLGERGLFKADRMDAALTAIVELDEKARAVGATDIRAVSTSGARRAMNAATFFDRIRERTGVKVEPSN